MKKITKVLGLLVVAAMLFVGCSPSTGNNNGNGGNNGNDGNDGNDGKDSVVDFDTALFDENSLTEDVDAIELSDGTWNYRKISEYNVTECSPNAEPIINTWTEKTQLEFSYKNGKFDDSDEGILNFWFYYCRPLPEDADEVLITKLKNLGYTIEGNNYSISKQYDKEQLVRLSEDAFASMTNDPSEYEFLVRYNPDTKAFDRYIDIIMDVSGSGDFDSITDKFKTNADKTQYYWNPHDKEALDKCFLVKK